MHTNRRTFLRGTAATGLALTGRAALGMPLATSAFSMDPDANGVAQAARATQGADAFTRGIGVYPGDPADYRGPALMPGGNDTRNLARLKPAYHSSAYDYNLTAHLITDGIATTEMPSWFACTVQGRILPKEQREILVDHEPVNLFSISGGHITVEMHAGGPTPPEVDRLDIFLVMPSRVNAEQLTFQISTSMDGHVWQPAGTANGGKALAPERFPPDMTRGAQVLQPSITFTAPVPARYYRVELIAPQAADGSGAFMQWQIGQVIFFRDNKRVEIGGPYQFTSAWKSAGSDEEWVYVDLLADSSIDAVKLHWIAAASHGSVQVSSDAHTWRDVKPLQGASGSGLSGPAASGVEDIRFAAPVRARYVRVLMTQPATEHGYILSELEVIGRGGMIAASQAAGAQAAGGSQSLSHGAWRVQRDTQVQATGAQLATAGFHDADWLPATVPGTTLTCYQNAGAVPDPNFGQNQLYISDSFFYADFWYRTEFATPTSRSERTWLCLDGINWKAEVFLNGESLGRVDGAFFRGKFDVTGKLRAGQRNALAIRVEKNATPGSVHQKTYERPSNNGGGLGADNPTFHASVGWDWIPTVRGRNTGVWADVRLLQTGEVTVEDPLVQTRLEGSIAIANVTVSAVLRNHSSKKISGRLEGRLGDVSFSREVTLQPNAEQTVAISPAESKTLRIDQPKLWWPNGYGEPYLHDAELRFVPQRGEATEPLHFKAGLRQMTANEDGDKLRLYCNGRRLIARGGNWGFSEVQLRYRAREYDAAMRYHREMNFNMVRNWVGQIGEDAFYEACDRHGILVWQDFWLANPWDGMLPDNNAMFLANGRDLVRRIRNHACLGIYCGRNEWYPPAPLDKGIPAILQEEHPDLHYIGSSADGPVSGHGPYHTLSAVEYFKTSDNKLHSEIGAPNIPPIESVRAMMPKSALWPQGLEYGLHDFTLEGAQGATSLLALIANVYGGATNAEDWIELAQFLNYETYRAMFEAQSRDRMGVLLWMSHPCWPSFVWQTYDYYLEPTAAYFGAKKACEPVHIQWNPLTDKIEVVNYNAGPLRVVEATAELLNPDGSSVWKKSVTLDAVEDSTSVIFPMEYPSALASIHFVRLTLRASDRMLSSNTYLRGREGDNLRDIRRLGKAQVTANTTQQRNGDLWQCTTVLKNTSSLPALLTRLKAVGGRDRERILPAVYEDNYFVLLPGESRTVRTELRQADTRGQQPAIVVEGFNVTTQA